MKYVFFGTPLFAAVVLKRLIDSGFIPTAVVCNPDRPFGRKKTITPPPVKRLIIETGTATEILQPENPLDIKNKLSDIGADLFVVAAYAKILPKEIISMPRLGTMGIHPSLLPKYRGASPIQSVLLGGDKETGITLYMLDEKTDHGPIIGIKKTSIADGTNYEKLMPELASLGGGFAAEAMPHLADGKIKPEPQDESAATYTKKITAEDAFVSEKDMDDAMSGKNHAVAVTIYRKTLALNPEPGVWTTKNGKRVKLIETNISPDGRLVLKKVQIGGEKIKG